MKSNSRLLQSFLVVTAAALLLCSCVEKKSEEKNGQPAQLNAPEKKQRTIIEPSLLPQRFQRAGYVVNDDEANTMLDSEASDEFQLKVGADITTPEPVTLRDAMKALIRNKNMSLSWASDVNQDLLVDIDVTAEDNFYEAIDNILRQLDYFHEIQGSTLIVKYRETKQYHVAMPFVKQEYNASIGGNSFGSDVRVDSKGNTFDIWENIQNNINSLISAWSATITTPDPKSQSEGEGDFEKDKGQDEEKNVEQTSRRVSSTESSYTIDKPIGLITVHAPKSLQKRISDYLQTLERELYKQITIEAKVIEVQLQNNSSLGINWQTLLKSLTFRGAVADAGNYYSKDNTENYDNGNSLDNISVNTANRTTSSTNSNSTENGNDNTATTGTSPNTASTTTSADSSLLSDSVSTLNSLTDTITSTTSAATTLATVITSGGYNAALAGIGIAGFSFDKFINALKEQGKTSVLSNPKISVMNGQPALISVGRE
ncbi:MAG: hypothetical protein D3908_10165, partial [Candidatus Electrothrix sp. AUS4]|nr:hypothetical protein [Candidatus Electrothrix sp. AUS4]